MNIIFNNFPHFWLIQYMRSASCFFGQCKSEQLLLEVESGLSGGLRTGPVHVQV